MLEEEISGEMTRRERQGQKTLGNFKTWYLCKISLFYRWTSSGGHGWAGVHRDVTRMISEYSISQKIKYQREPNWENHHLYSLDPYLWMSWVERGRIGKSIHSRYRGQLFETSWTISLGEKLRPRSSFMLFYNGCQFSGFLKRSAQMEVRSLQAFIGHIFFIRL